MYSRYNILCYKNEWMNKSRINVLNLLLGNFLKIFLTLSQDLNDRLTDWIILYIWCSQLECLYILWVVRLPPRRLWLGLTNDHWSYQHQDLLQMWAVENPLHPRQTSLKQCIEAIFFINSSWTEFSSCLVSNKSGRKLWKVVLNFPEIQLH